jgi:membrane protein
MATDQTARDRRFERKGDEPDSPSDLKGRSWFGVLKRTVKEFQEDNLTDWAASLTYYGILALFPGLLVLISLIGLAGANTAQSLIDNIASSAPGSAKTVITNALREIQNGSKGSAGLLFIVGLAGALWSASAYVGVFFMALSLIAVVVTGGLADQVGKLLGIGHTAVQVWDIAKWPVLVVLVAVMIAVLYWASPNVKQPGFRWISPGSLLAVVIWIVASAAFALYVANFSSYNKTYGSLAGVIIFLVWMWISNVAILLGAEFDAELTREREIEAGRSDGDPILPPRDTRKLKDA